MSEEFKHEEFFLSEDTMREIIEDLADVGIKHKLSVEAFAVVLDFVSKKWIEAAGIKNPGMECVDEVTH